MMGGGFQRLCDTLHDLQSWIASTPFNIRHVGARYAGDVSERLLR